MVKMCAARLRALVVSLREQDLGLGFRDQTKIGTPVVDFCDELDRAADSYQELEYEHARLKVGLVFDHIQAQEEQSTHHRGNILFDMYANPSTPLVESIVLFVESKGFRIIQSGIINVPQGGFSKGVVRQFLLSLEKQGPFEHELLVEQLMVEYCLFCRYEEFTVVGGSK